MGTDPILRAFAALARRRGTDPIVATRGRAVSVGDVDALARGVEARLAAAGAAPGSYVLLAAANGAGFLAAVLGARRAGLVPVLADWTAPAAERARVAAALGIATVLTCNEVFPDEASSFRVVGTGVAGANPPAGADYVKLTSGSSGAPCGVATAAEALAADDEQLAASMGLRPGDRFVAAIPWSHSYGLTTLVLSALRRGSLLVVPDDPGPWAPLDAARAWSATVFPTVPIFLQTISSLAQVPAWPATLHTVISAGAPLLPENAERFRDTFGLSAHVLYGASECGGISYDREGGAALRGTVGTPVEGVTIELEGPDAPREGAVVVRSAAVGLAHVPAGGGSLDGGAFASADRAAWTAGGELRLLGRADELINVGGKKVLPAEVEAVLCALPGVREAVVLGVLGADGGREVVRAVVACDRAALDYRAVAAWCRSRLAGHKVPRSIILVDEIPRTARGKVDRAVLARLAPARTPE